MCPVPVHGHDEVPASAPEISGFAALSIGLDKRSLGLNEYAKTEGQRVRDLYPACAPGCFTAGASRRRLPTLRRAVRWSASP